MVFLLSEDWKVPLESFHAQLAKQQQHDSSNDDADMKVFKFPKIPHAINLGAATRDDKISSMAELELIFGNIKQRCGGGGGGGGGGESGRRRVYVEEKIDGANMGLFITLKGKIVAQNRSHFITSAYHAQFGPLDKWIAKHSADLWEILEPGRHVRLCTLLSFFFIFNFLLFLLLCLY